MKLISKALNALSDNNLRIKGLVRWKYSTKLSFRIFSLENFTNNELILSLREDWSEHLSLCLPSVSSEKWVFDKAPPHPRKWVNSTNQNTDAENGAHQGRMFGVVILIWFAIWKLLMFSSKE